MPRGHEHDPMSCDVVALVFMRAFRTNFSLSFPRKRL